MSVPLPRACTKQRNGILLSSHQHVGFSCDLSSAPNHWPKSVLIIGPKEAQRSDYEQSLGRVR